MRRPSFCLALLLALGVAACGEEKKEDPPNPPKILTGDIRCDLVEGDMVLESISFKVEDRDGLETLKAPEMVVVSTPITPVITPQPATVEGEPATQVVYTWQRDKDSELFYCGEGGDELDVTLVVTDEEGFTDETTLPSRPKN